MHFSPLQFSYTDSRGQKSEEPPKLHLRLPEKKKSAAKNDLKRDDEIDTTTPVPYRSRHKRKYGCSVAQRKEKRRSVRSKKRDNDTESVRCEKESRHVENDANADKEVDFGGQDELDFDPNFIAFNENADEKNHSSSEEDEPPIQRRLFTKKLVIEESDDEESDNGVISGVSKKIDEKRLEIDEPDDESAADNFDGGVFRSDIKSKKCLEIEESGDDTKWDSGKKSTTAKSTKRSSNDAPAETRRKMRKTKCITEAQSMASKSKGKNHLKNDETNESESEDELKFNGDVGARDNASNTVIKKRSAAATKSRQRQGKVQPAAEKSDDESNDEFEFDEDKEPVRRKPANVVTSKSSAKLSEEITPTTRQCAWIAKKSAFAKSPYAQEMYAKAEAALKNGAADGNKKQILHLRDESESTDDESAAVKKARHSSKKPAAKKIRSVAKNESDEDSEYQPTQELKKLARSTRSRRKQSVDSECDKSCDVIEMKSKTVLSTGKFAAKNAAQKKQIVEVMRETTNSVTMSPGKQLGKKKPEKKKSTSNSRKEALIKGLVPMGKKRDVQSDDESEYQPTQCDLDIEASQSEMASITTKKAISKSKGQQKTKYAPTAQELNATERVTRSRSKKSLSKDDDSFGNVDNIIANQEVVGMQNDRGECIGEATEWMNKDETKSDGEEWGGANIDLFREEPLENEANDHYASDNLEKSKVDWQKDDGIAVNEKTFACIELNTKTISTADQRNIFDEIQKQTEDSQPSTPSKSQMQLSAVISSEKQNPISECASDTDKAAMIRLKTLTERLKKIKDAKQQIQLIEEELQQELNALVCIN